MLKMFGRNVTENVRSQKVLYFSTSPNECLCTTYSEMPNHENRIFSPKFCITAVPDFQQVGLIYSVLLVATHTHAAYESQNLVVSGVKFWTVMGP